MNEITILNNKCQAQTKLIENLKSIINEKNNEIFELSANIEMDNVETNYEVNKVKKIKINR